MKVRITPAYGYAHGHVERTLAGIGIQPPVADEAGVVELDLSEVQIQQFQLRGSAHRLERVEVTRTPVSASGGESPIPETVILGGGIPAPGLYLVHYPPTVDELESLLQCPHDFAVEIHRANELRAQGLTEAQIEEVIWPPSAPLTPEELAFLGLKPTEQTKA